MRISEYLVFVVLILLLKGAGKGLGLPVGEWRCLWGKFLGCVGKWNVIRILFLSFPQDFYTDPTTFPPILCITFDESAQFLAVGILRVPTVSRFFGRRAWRWCGRGPQVLGQLPDMSCESLRA